MSLDNPQKSTQEWPHYPDPGAATSEPEVHDHDAHGPAKRGGHGGTHGGHGWMMALMCLPLVAIGIWQWVGGAGIGALVGGLACFGMMAVMHLGMGGSSHRH